MRYALTGIMGFLWLFGDTMALEPERLESEMQRLKVRSALVVRSQAVDEQPYWSPKGDALAVNIEGQWLRLDLASVTLVAGTWHQKEAVGLGSPSAAPISTAEAEAWGKTGTTGPLEVVTKSGTRVEIVHNDLGSSFVISRKGAPPETLWRTSLESCHGLSLSPDDRHVAYVCELNGVIVTRL